MNTQKNIQVARKVRTGKCAEAKAKHADAIAKAKSDYRQATESAWSDLNTETLAAHQEYAVATGALVSTNETTTTTAEPVTAIEALVETAQPQVMETADRF